MNLTYERSYPTSFANSPLLPLLILSLARQKNYPKTATTVADEYDYIIIGAGSAGSVMASRLSEMTCFSVLLLEAGGRPPVTSDVPQCATSFFGTDIDWNYRTVPQRYAGSGLENREFAWHSGKGIGGSSLMSGGLEYRGNPRDYNDWAASGAKGWSYEDVLPYFYKLEDYRSDEYLANGFHAVGGPVPIEDFLGKSSVIPTLFEAFRSQGIEMTDPNGLKQTGYHRMKPSTRDGQACSSAKAYLVPAENRKNLDIVSHAMVTKILIDHHRRATGVQFDHDGQVHLAGARKEVIVCAGAVETPKLLMLSGIGPRKELEKYQIPVLADLPVGYNLQDHIFCPVNFAVADGVSMTSIEDKRSDLSNTLQYIWNRTGIYSHTFGFYNSAFVKKENNSRGNDVPDFQITFGELPRETMQTVLGINSQVYQEIYRSHQGKPVHTCYAGPLRPRSRGIIRLRSTNPYDDPIIDPRYYQDPQDLDDMVEGIKVCLQLIGSPPMKRLGCQEPQNDYPGCESWVDEDDYWRCVAQAIAMSWYHYSGTAKMGDPADPSTVVDPQLRVKTIHGLRVVDVSVMPTIPSANTHIPTTLVAEKAADMVKDTVACSEVIQGQEGYPVFYKNLND